MPTKKPAQTAKPTQTAKQTQPAKQTQAAKQTLFEFFSLSFSQSEQCPIGGHVKLDEATERFNKLFQERKNLPIRLNDKSEELPNHIYEVEDHVFLIRLHNKQVISYIKEKLGGQGQAQYVEDTVKSYPYLYIVVDNRNACSKIAIMKSPIFGSTLDKVCRMMSHLFSQWMQPLGVDVTLNACRVPKKFWAYVKECIESGHRLLSLNISFNTNDKKQTTIVATRLSRNVAGLMNIAKAMQALKAEFKLTAPPVSQRQMLLNKNLKDIAQIVGLCSTNDFALNVKFRGLPIYKYNGDESVKAVFPMPTSAITEMIESEDNIDGFINWAEGTKKGLVIWLDSVNKQLFDYKIHAEKND